MDDNVTHRMEEDASDQKKKNSKSDQMIEALQEATHLYCRIRKIIILDETFRQNRETPEEKEYLEFLNRLRYGTCTDADLQAVKARMKANIGDENEIAEFSGALHIYPYREMVRKRNK